MKFDTIMYYGIIVTRNNFNIWNKCPFDIFQIISFKIAKLSKILQINFSSNFADKFLDKMIKGYD